MNEEHHDELDRLLGEFEPPPPPRQLRARALAAARETSRKKPEADRWSKILENRGLRFAWAAAVVVLLAGHLLVEPGAGVVPKHEQPHLVAANGVDEQLVDLIRPVHISIGVRPMLGGADVDESLIQELEGNPS